ncbi:MULTISPECIES: carbohydrate ABC transporter permease [unclassified Hyphomicrobium]|uniref:carbohydrate ABC transporter permease n=1 Tax=unclassified Hyphomicrobium TaxID=2619925 RepID=UPI000213E6CC|nr:MULTISPECIES: sugar ABC transporter permease [unclassified Hyphomicrobium]CCB67140.1 Binding-protein-dependent transport systems inner membrane component [Hyphomicrobium sp. MC1]
MTVKRRMWNDRSVFILFCMVPVVLFLTITSLVPSVMAISDSLTDWRLTSFGSHDIFVGLSNYRRLLGEDPQFWSAVVRTLVFVVIVVPVELALGMAIALFLAREFKGRRLVLTLLMIPTMIAPVVVAMTWRFMLMPSFGLLTYVLNKFGFFTDASVFSGEISAFAAIMLIDIWEWTPFMMLILLSGLNALPHEPQEAAELDGATRTQIFFHVQLPMLRPLIIIAVLFRTIDASKVFDTIYVLTGGGPGANATESLTLFAQKTIFGTWQLGYGAAVCQVLAFLSIVAAALFYSAVSKSEAR